MTAELISSLQHQDRGLSFNMKTIYTLTVPRHTPNAFLRPHISVPNSEDGIKLASWWEKASAENKIALILLGDETRDYVKVWKQANEMPFNSPDAKSEHDEANSITRAFRTNEELADPSAMSEPPVTNP